MIEKRKTIKTADKILKLIYDNTTIMFDNEGWVDLFGNYQMKGYTIVIEKYSKYKNISFGVSEDKDKITVFSSDNFDYDRNTSPNLWDNAEDFKYDDYQGVIAYIRKLINDWSDKSV